MRTIPSTLLFIGFSAAGAHAGAIVAKVVNHDLVVTGSAGDDDVVIEQAAGGKHRFKLTPGGTSTVNGSASAVLLDDASGDLRVDLRGGANTASVAGADVGGDVRIDETGAGTLSIVFGDVDVKRDVVARSNAGSLSLIGSALRIAGNFDERCGGAPDQILLVGGCSVGGRMTVDLGGGGSLVQLMQCGVHGPTKVRCGAGVDTILSFNATFGPLSIDLGDAMNSALLEDVVIRGNFRFDGGDALDELNTIAATIEGGAMVNLRGGMNAATLASMTVKRSLSVRAGGADDEVHIGEDTHVGGACSISLGGGHDLFSVAKSSLGSLRVRGGSGRNDNAIDTAQIDGSCRFDLGSSPAGPGDNVDLINSACLGSFAVRSKGGDDFVSLSVFDVAGAASISLGDGKNKFMSQGLRARSLAGKSGNGDDEFSVVLFDTSGAARFAVGGGKNSVTLAEGFAGGDLSVQAGAGDDTLQLLAVDVGGKQSIHLGGGANTGP